MNTAIQCFDFKENPVRVIDREGAPWFVAADVCRVLEIGNPTESLRGLDDDEKMTLSSAEGHSGQRGGARSHNIVSESGLYALIFKSRKPQAKAFRKWVTAEVLPAIRKTGEYRAEKPAEIGLEAIDRPVTVPDFLRTCEGVEGMSYTQIVGFGRRVQGVARAFGVPVVLMPSQSGFGMLRAFPTAVCHYALQSLKAQRTDKVGEFLKSAVADLDDDGTLTLGDLMRAAQQHGMLRRLRLGRGAHSRLGRELNAYRGARMRDGRGRSFQIIPRRTSLARVYDVIFESN